MTQPDGIAPASQPVPNVQKSGPREIKPVTFGNDADDNLYDFRPRPVDSEVPDPKDSSAAESADFSGEAEDLIPDLDKPENSSPSAPPATPAPVVKGNTAQSATPPAL